jgi:hypothetical protein
MRLVVQNHFPGIIVDHKNTNLFKVKPCPEKHTGQGRALINYRKRDGTKRFQIVRLMAPGGRVAYAAVVGHYDDDDIMKLDYDMRTALALKIDDEVPIEVKKCGLLGVLRWYLTVPDPLVRVSACLALISMALGVVSMILAFAPG